MTSSIPTTHKLRLLAYITIVGLILVDRMQFSAANQDAQMQQNAQMHQDAVSVAAAVPSGSSNSAENNVQHQILGPSPRDPMAINYYPSRRERPPKVEEETLRLPGQTGTGTKPTKYHYYPHNQHIYLLPECAVQQVCNAVYVRLNYTQPLCACPSRYREPCSASLNSDDLHTTELSTDPKGKILTLVKTCEPVSDMRLCRSPRDWSLLALQNIRTGKSHYLVICRCPDSSVLEGPMSHDQPTYASVPGIRVYGMMCVNQTATATAAATKSATQATKRRGRPLRVTRAIRPHRDNSYPPFPWSKVNELIKTMEKEEEENESNNEIDEDII